MNKKLFLKNFISILKILLGIILFSVIVFGVPYGITALFTHNEQIRLGVMFLVGYTFLFILLISVILSIE